MLTPDALASLGDAEGHNAGGFRFCASKGCQTVYISPDRGEVFQIEQVRLPVFQKSTDPDRPVCYCFRHSVRDVRRDARREAPRIEGEIRNACRKGLHRCEEENPQGKCCLGNIRNVAKGSTTSDVEMPASAGKQGRDEERDDCCCAKRVIGRSSSDAKSAEGTGEDRVTPNGERSGLLAAGGAVLAAVLSSACCWLPLSLIAAGLSAGSVGTLFDAYRFHFLGATALMLGGGFYLVYRKPKCAPGDACATPNRRLQKLNRVILWTATGLVALFALFPDYAGYVLADDDTKPEGFSARAAETLPGAGEADAAEEAEGKGTVHVYSIVGMSCEACTAHVRDSLREMPGVSAVHVSYEDRLARVTFAADLKPDDGAVLRAIEELGYRAEVR